MSVFRSQVLLVALSGLFSCILTSQSVADDPCVSGLAPGKRPGPYSFVISTGPDRGRDPQCYICKTADLPAVIVFARKPSDPLGKLVGQLDKALVEHKATDLRAWVTFLSNDQAKLDPELVRWSQKHGLKSIPVGTFESESGPVQYQLAANADVTVLLFVKRKVVANFAFRAGELNDEASAEVMKALPKIIEAMK
jgi:hypothetical protein